MSHCEICGEALANSVNGYAAHLKRFHSANPHPSLIEALKGEAKALETHSIRPIRTTTRSKAQIVHDVEKTWGMSIMPHVMPWHALGDR